MIDKQQETAKELRKLILRGTCPYCASVRIKYREYLTNQTFGFHCLSCDWKSQYNLSELKQASEKWFPIQK